MWNQGPVCPQCGADDNEVEIDIDYDGTGYHLYCPYCDDEMQTQPERETPMRNHYLLVTNRDKAYGFTALVITVPAPISAYRPISLPHTTVALAPILAPFLTNV